MNLSLVFLGPVLACALGKALEAWSGGTASIRVLVMMR